MKVWKQSHHLFFVVGLGLAAWPAQAASGRIELDLALSPGERTEEVRPGELLAFELIHRVPRLEYTTKVQREVVPIDAIAPPEPLAQPQGEDPCEAISQVDNQLSLATEESAVATLVAEAQKLIEEDQCPNPDVVDLLRETLGKTREPLRGEFILNEGELVRITVSRPDGDGVKTWVFVFTTGSRGTWLTSYGFTFLGNRDRTFFSRPTDDGKFTIAEKKSSGGGLSDLNFTPSFFYTWLPRRDENRDWSPGLTFGLGFDQSHPILFAGGSLNYNRFVSLIAGVAIHQQKRLNGQYRVGQPLEEALADDALHEERFGVNYFFGLSFRFNANPFSSDSGDAKPAEPAEPAKPTPTPGGNS